MLAYPLASATDARRSLNLQGPLVSISPSKQRSVRMATAKVREQVLSQFTQGERVSNDEGSMTRMCERIYIKTLVEEHNQGGAHMNLHASIYLGFQFFKNVRFCAFSTPFLTLNSARAVNSPWQVTAGCGTRRSDIESWGEQGGWDGGGLPMKRMTRRYMRRPMAA